MICHTKNDASGTSSASDAEKKDGSLIPGPERKKLFVPHAPAYNPYRYHKPRSLTLEDQKKMSDFAALAKQRWEERRNKLNEKS